eukprot:scaffold361_cov248-Pinguiococcus_pyrenoidosus.AAC.13
MPLAGLLAPAVLGRHSSHVVCTLPHGATGLEQVTLRQFSEQEEPAVLWVACAVFVVNPDQLLINGRVVGSALFGLEPLS